LRILQTLSARTAKTEIKSKGLTGSNQHRAEGVGTTSSHCHLSQTAHVPKRCSQLPTGAAAARSAASKRHSAKEKQANRGRGYIGASLSLTAALLCSALCCLAIWCCRSRSQSRLLDLLTRHGAARHEPCCVGREKHTVLYFTVLYCTVLLCCAATSDLNCAHGKSIHRPISRRWRRVRLQLPCGNKSVSERFGERSEHLIRVLSVEKRRNNRLQYGTSFLVVNYGKLKRFMCRIE
jgi:hypothetical protein